MEYYPPEKVMATAATPLDANATLDVEWTVESPTIQCLLFGARESTRKRYKGIQYYAKWKIFLWTFHS